MAAPPFLLGHHGPSQHLPDRISGDWGGGSLHLGVSELLLVHTRIPMTGKIKESLQDLPKQCVSALCAPLSCLQFLV